MKNLMSCLFLVFAVASIGASCNSPPLTPVATPPTPTDSSDCALACQKMQSLNCEEGQPVPTPNGGTVSCEVFCQHEIDTNNVELNSACIKGITSCDQINTSCSVGKVAN